MPVNISIVTISYNQSAFLERAISSVLDQKYPDLQYILVDPGSTDGSRGIIDRYRHCLDAVILEPDRGPADGLNKGFSCATGEVFGFINADDAIAPGSLHYVNRYFETHPDIDVLLAAGFVIDEHDRVRRRVLPSQFSVRRYVTGGFEFIQQGMFFRREAYLAAGGFNTENRTCWDGELLLDMAVVGKHVGCSDANIGLFRLHGASISGSGRLNAAYACDQKRLFKKAMKRDRTVLDEVFSLCYKTQKVIRTPAFYLRRYCEGRPYRLGHPVRIRDS